MLNGETIMCHLPIIEPGVDVINKLLYAEIKHSDWSKL